MNTEILNRAKALIEELSEKGMIQLVNDDIIATAAYMTEEQPGVDFSEGEFWRWDETGVISIDAEVLAEILEMIEENEEGQREVEEEREAEEEQRIIEEKQEAIAKDAIERASKNGSADIEDSIWVQTSESLIKEQRNYTAERKLQISDDSDDCWDEMDERFAKADFSKFDFWLRNLEDFVPVGFNSVEELAELI